MDILVIGNGFDLAHDLKTKYKDFLEYCISENNKRFPISINYGTTFIDNIWLRHFIIKQHELGDTWIDLEQEIYNVIKTVVKTIKNLSNGEPDCIFPMIFSIQKDVIDFDFNNISNYLKTAYNNLDVKDKGYVDVKMNDFSSLYTYIGSYNGFIKFLYDKLREFTKEFENYLTNNALSELPAQPKYQLSIKSIDILRGTSPLNVLSFNYTDTCEKIYNGHYTNYGKFNIKTFYVHGKICNSETCNLVMGTRSFNKQQMVDNNNPMPVKINIFQKHNQRHKYGTIEEYQELLKILNENNNIQPVFHVVGHSLDETDHNILKHIFLANKNAIINIYYHDEESQEILIHNITEIIEEKEVMTRVRMIYQHDDERGILLERK